MIRDGAYAEYVALPAADIATKPETLDFVHAAVIPHVILTAWQALIEAGGLSEGQTVLIHGAGGGVGHVAVQLAKSRGAKVIGTPGSWSPEVSKVFTLPEIRPAHELIENRHARGKIAVQVAPG